MKRLFKVESYQNSKYRMFSDQPGFLPSTAGKSCYIKPGTKIAPKNPWLEDELPFGMVPFQGTFVHLRGGYDIRLEFPNTQYLLKVCS